MVSERSEGVVFEELEVSECHRLLALAEVGRLGLTINALPVVLPVNFALVGDAVVFRSIAGTKFSAALQKTVVAFEVDDYEPNGDVGWSVLVQGIASEITDPGQIARSAELRLRPLSPGGKDDHFVGVELLRVTGRRIRPRYATE